MSNQPIEYPAGPTSILPNKLLRQFMRNPIKTLMETAKTFGDISHFKFGKQHIYLLSNPQYIEDVLIKDHDCFIKSRGLQLSKRLLGEGLLTSEGEFHDRQRRIIQPAFHPNRIKAYGDIMTRFAERMCLRWKDGESLDIHKEMMRITSAIISKTVLGSDIDLEGDTVNDALLTCMKHLNRLQMPFGELIEKIPILPSTKGFQVARNELDSIVFKMIKEHKDAQKRNLVSINDLLYTLIDAQDSEAGSVKMPDSQLRDEVMTVFLAGHETTANALTWTFYLLSQYPAVEQRLYDELCLVLLQADGGMRIPTVDDIPSLEFTEKVLRESMRLYPPAWTIGRQAIRDYFIDKYTIHSGAIILMSQYVMHRDPRYFHDPELFHPDRWTREFKSALPKFSYFPFGGGIRGCVGEPFAWIEGVLLIATVCRHWKMHHHPRHRVELKPLVTLRPKYGMLMTLEQRRNSVN